MFISSSSHSGMYSVRKLLAQCTNDKNNEENIMKIWIKSMWNNGIRTHTLDLLHINKLSYWDFIIQYFF